MYRFRTIEGLLGKHKELENQEIYFASPDELNDPMEGYKDVFWKGDSIIWKNFIKNYTRSLENVFGLALLLNDKEKLNENNISILPPSPSGIAVFNKKTLIEQILEDVFKIEFIKNLPKVLSERKNVIRRSELQSYLELIHPFILDSISRIYIQNNIIIT
ncbi:MAG: hypothetical protein JNM51_04285, partial [Bacteroidia bacterium]|nr:hypothetical protein [Bacteroidia bacterium]